MKRALSRLSLHTRVSLLLTALAACLLAVLAALWLRGTQSAIHEEVEAAGRVSTQMLTLLVRDVSGRAALVEAVRPLGRIRAHELLVTDAAGQIDYRSPASTYKAGRQAPDWLGRLVSSEFEPRVLPVGDARLVLRPDPSRALVDAWDELVLVSGWALLLLLGIFLAARQALHIALRPLDAVMAALDETGRGRFDVRLPVFAPPELARLSRAFNGMADRLRAAVDHNVRLETRQELDRCIQSRLEGERREIARELHDELAQGVTAVRALAGAIVQRSGEQPAIHGAAQGIVAVTGEMQAGVRNILHRLQPPEAVPDLAEWLATWARRHPEIVLDGRLTVPLETLPVAQAQAVLRLVQEGLTNVLRHARASRVELSMTRDATGLDIRLADNGCGFQGSTSSAAGCGMGLNGMRDRLAGLGGWLEIIEGEAGGLTLHARLPHGMEKMQCTIE